MATDNRDEIEYFEGRVMELEKMRVFYTQNGDIEQADAYEMQMESVLDGIEDLEDEQDLDYAYAAAAEEAESEEEEEGEEEEGEGEEGGGEEIEMMMMAQQEEAVAEEEAEEEEEQQLALEEEAAAAEEGGEEEQAESDPMDPSQYDQNELYQAVWEKIQEKYPSKEGSFENAEKQIQERLRKMNQEYRKGL